MKPGIKYRLFFSLLAATGLVVVGMFLIMQWSLARGFLQYIHRLDRERLDHMAVALEEGYAQQKEWDFLRQDPGELTQIMAQALPESRKRPVRTGGEGATERPREHTSPHLGHRFERRVRLLDDQRRPVIGPMPEERVELIPLHHEEQIVGWLGLQPKKRLTDINQLRFLRHQKFAMGLVAGLMLLVSALLALPLSNRLVRPIRALAAGTRRLAAGEYGARVPVDSGDELGQLGRDFNALALALEQNERDRRQWVADISHELRTPLSVLRGEIEALQDGVRPQTPQALASLHGEVLQLGRLVDDLYQLSLSDLGALNYRKEQLDLAVAVDQAIEMLRPQFEKRKITVDLDLPPRGEALIHGDQARLNQLMANLLDNSLKYTDAGGRLHLGLTVEGGRLLLDLQDTPPGVGDADLKHLFERLYRVESSRNRASGGAGLGLSICFNIVEAHGGKITAAHSPLGGLWIEVDLPGESPEA